MRHDLAGQPPAHADARGLFRRLSLGSLGQILLITTFILRNILIVPFFIATHGVDGYADWVKLLSVATLINVIVTMGQNFYYSFRIRTARAARDDAAMNRAFADANTFYIFLIAIMTLCVLPIFFVSNVLLIMNTTVLLPWQANLVFAVLLLSLIGQNYWEAVRAIYIGYGDLVRSQTIQIVANFMIGASACAALWLHAEITIVALIYFCVMPCLVCVTAFADFRRYPELRVGISRGWPNTTRERWRSLVAHSVPQIASRVLFNGPTVLLGVFGVAADTLVQFSLARTASTVLSGRQLAMVFAIEMTRQRTQEDWTGFRRLHRRGAVFMGLVGGAIVGGLTGVWDVFLPIWTNGALTADMLLFGLLAAEMAMLTLGQHSAALLRFGGRMADVARCELGAALVFLVIGTPALALGGVYAMLAVMILGAALFWYLAPAWYAHHNMQTSFGVAVTASLGVGSVTGVAVYALLQLVRGGLGW